MALAEASLKIVRLAIRSISKSLIFCTLASKPSKMNNGAFGSFTYEPFRSISSLPISMDEAPRKVIFGSLFGSEPNSMLSKIIKEGSKFLRL